MTDSLDHVAYGKWLDEQSPEKILSDLLLIPASFQRAPARRGLVKTHVFQDGADFYEADRVTGGTRRLATFPYQVNDYDQLAMIASREWFVETWCPEHGIEPIWESTK